MKGLHPVTAIVAVGLMLLTAEWFWNRERSLFAIARRALGA